MTAPERLEVEYELTPEDYKAFFRYVLPGQRLGIVFLILLTVVVFAWIFLLPILHDVLRLQLQTHDFFLGAAVGFVGAYALCNVATLRHRAQSMARYIEGNTKLFAPRRLTLSAEGIRKVNEFFEVLIRWISIRKITITGRGVFVFTGSQEAILVPRRAFADDAAYDAFIDLTRHYLDATTARFADRPRSPTETYHASDPRFDDRRVARH